MKVLVLGGMHGNEPLGLAVVKLLQDKPIQNVTAAYANEEAVANNSRFIVQDLNRSFPGDAQSAVYEARRAAELMRLAAGYEVVLDFHNTHCPENDCGFVGETASPQLYDVAGLLGLDKVIVADYDCINKYAPNCLSVEVSLDSAQCSAEVWYERIALLARLKKVAVDATITKYRFVYRMTLEDKARLDLPNQNLQAFRPLPARLAKAMGVNTPAYPIFIGDGYTPYNYGGVLHKIGE